MPITIHPELEAKLRARAEAAGITVETYIERIALDDQAAEEELEALALANPRLQEFIAGLTVRKVVVIPKKLVNVVAT